MTVIDDISTRRNGSVVDHDTDPRPEVAMPQPAQPSPPLAAVQAPVTPRPTPVADPVRPDKTLLHVRFAARVLLALVGIAAAALSFSSLANLAARAGYPEQLSYLWPGVVDGTILLATIAIDALDRFRVVSQRDRRFFWMVLVTSAVVSVGGNVMHSPSVLPPNMPLPVWLAIPIAAVAPLSLLACVHGASILGRLRVSNTVPDSGVGDGGYAEMVSVHDAVAVVVKERNPEVKCIAERSVGEISEILALVADGTSQRQIKRLTGGTHHRHVTTIARAGAEVRGVDVDDVVEVDDRD